MKSQGVHATWARQSFFQGTCKKEQQWFFEVAKKHGLQGIGHLKVVIPLNNFFNCSLNTLTLALCFCGPNHLTYLFTGLLSRYPTELNVEWNAVGKHPVTNETFMKYMAGPNILSLVKRNCSLKVFEKLRTTLKRRYMSKRMSLMHKLDIFKEYSYPNPFPRDKFLKLPFGSPDQAYLMLSTKGTGW